MKAPRECIVYTSPAESARVLIGLSRLRLWMRGDRTVVLGDADCAALERAAQILGEIHTQAVASSIPETHSPPGHDDQDLCDCKACAAARVVRRLRMGDL